MVRDNSPEVKIQRIFVMNAVDINTTLQSLGKLDISDRTTIQDADAAMEILGDFNA
jgi:hypothetical protein